MYFILLTNVGEPKCYDEVLQVDTKIQWDSIIKDEMDSLLKKRLEIYASFLQVKGFYKLSGFKGSKKRKEVRKYLKPG